MRTLIIAMALILSACSHSSDKPAAPKVSTPLLFEITPPDGGPKSYLLGTMHIGIGLDEFPAAMIRLHDNAQVQAYEMNVLDEIDLLAAIKTNPEYAVREITRIQTQRGILRGGRALNSSEINQITSVGIPYVIAQNMTTMSSCMMIEGKSAFLERPFHSLDAELMRKTLNGGRTMLELDTRKLRDDATTYSKSVGYKEDDCRIQDVLNNPEKLRREVNALDSMADTYRRMTPQALMTMGSDTSPETAYRNKAWIPKLVPVLKTKSTFIAVGFFHLPGNIGLIQLLRDQGFRVEPARL